MAKLPDDYVQRVTDATDIVGVIGEHVKLKKAGAEFAGLCPFHNEKTPSFYVNPGKNVFTCRGCGDSGNAIQFLMKHTGSEFQETVAALAKRAGLPGPMPSVRGDRENGQYVRLLDVMDRAKAAYQEALQANDQALRYLRERGVTAEMVDRFAIGYAPRGGNFLREKLPDVDEKDLVAAGLVYKSEYEQGKMLEWMNHRIVFPIFSATGKNLGFGGRSLVPGAKRKYINTPETILFKKGSELFGLHQASAAIRKENQVIVTEGYMDAVVPAAMGVGNVVAGMGTAFSVENLKKLFRMADSVVFCFDPDAAGRRAALRAMEFAAEVVDDRKRCRFAFLPDGTDPDEFVLQNGTEAFRKFIAGSDPMSKFLVREFMARNDMTCAEGKACFASEAMAVIERIQSPLLRAFMIDDVRSVIGPNIPLPGVTPGVEAIVPEPLVTQARSATRVFREHKLKQAVVDAQPERPQPVHEAPQTAPEQAVAARVEQPRAQASNENPLGAKPPANAASAEANGSLGGSVESTPTSEQHRGDGPARLKFRQRPTMIATAREAERQEPPSQALRLLAFILRAPMIAGPGEMRCTSLAGSPEEIEAVQEAIRVACVPEHEQHRDHPSKDELVAIMKSSAYAKQTQCAMQSTEFQAEDMDVIGEAAAMLAHLAEKVKRANKAQRMKLSRPS